MEREYNRKKEYRQKYEVKKGGRDARRKEERKRIRLSSKTFERWRNEKLRRGLRSDEELATVLLPSEENTVDNEDRKRTINEQTSEEEGLSKKIKMEVDEDLYFVCPAYPMHTTDSAGYESPCSIYMDYNATTPLEPAVVETITSTLLDAWGNPSSTYPQGLLAKKVINKAREQVAEMIGASPSEIIFTSGGTEANNLVIHTAMEYFKSHASSSSSPDMNGLLKPHVITSNLEHDSIKLPLEHLVARGAADVTFVPASTKTGRVEPNDIMNAIRLTTCLVTVMHANNETGVIQPVEEIFGQIRKREMPSGKLPQSGEQRQILPKILLHTDAAQTIGKIQVNVKSLHADYLTVVGHKFYGPRIGALFVHGGAGEGSDVPLHPMQFGGGQERNFRPGTENTGMIAGLGLAAELVTRNLQQYETHMRKVRDYLEQSLESAFSSRVHINGRLPGSARLPNTCNVSITGSNLQGRKVLSQVETLQASVGAACHSHDGHRPSHILLAIGVPYDIACNALRLSVGRGTTEDDIDTVVDDIRIAVAKLESESH